MREQSDKDFPPSEADKMTADHHNQYRAMIEDHKSEIEGLEKRLGWLRQEIVTYHHWLRADDEVTVESPVKRRMPGGYHDNEPMVNHGR